MAIGFFLVVWPLLAFVGLLSATFLIYTIYIYVVHRRYEHLPGPLHSSFYMGHVDVLRKYYTKGVFIGQLFHQWHETYGPVLKFYVFHRCQVSVASPSIVKEVLTKSKLFIKTPKIYDQLFKLYGVRFMGKGLVTQTDHYAWHKRRVALNPAFHKKYLRMFMSQFNSVGDKWVEKLSSLAEDQTTFNMHDHLCRVTLDAISEVAFNYKMNAVETCSNVYLDHILNILKGTANSIRFPMDKYYPSRREFRKSVGESVVFLRGLGAKLLQQRRAAMANRETVPEDVLTFIIRVKADAGEEVGDGLTDEDILDDFITFFVAGQETTANALSFLFGEIGRRPEIARKLQDEVDSVLEGRDSVDFDDLNRLEYVGQVFKESLRLYPPAPGTTRMNVQEVTVDGFRIPKKSTIMLYIYVAPLSVYCTLIRGAPSARDQERTKVVLRQRKEVSFYTIQRLSKHYEDANEFNPDNFSADAERKLFTFLPFSAGSRSCIGQQFAQIEAKVLLSKFFQRFNVKCNPKQTLDIAGEAATMRPEGGTMMSISLR